MGGGEQMRCEPAATERDNTGDRTFAERMLFPTVKPTPGPSRTPPTSMVERYEWSSFYDTVDSIFAPSSHHHRINLTTSTPKQTDGMPSVSAQRQPRPRDGP